MDRELFCKEFTELTEEEATSVEGGFIFSVVQELLNGVSGILGSTASILGNTVSRIFGIIRNYRPSWSPPQAEDSNPPDIVQ